MAGVTKTYDHALLLHNGAEISASAAGNIAGTACVLDLGAGHVYGDIIVDVTVLDIDSSNEIVTIGPQVSDVAACTSSYYQLACLQLGHASAIAGDVSMSTGRYVIPFNNMIGDGTCKRYLRLYFTIAGTVAGFDCTAYLSLKS